MSVNGDQIVVFIKFKHNNEGFKYFIGCQEGEFVKLLCIILPQMNASNTLKTGAKTCLF